jgi:hypothetical protein
MTDIPGLIERLRKWRAVICPKGEAAEVWFLAQTDMDTAADALSRLSEDLAASQKIISAADAANELLMTKFERLSEDKKRLEEALKPFANRADQYDQMIVDEIKPSLVRDCIAARSALRGE